MNDLINFIIKYSRWFIFMLYVIISCVLLFNNNPYQHHIYLTSAGTITSSIYQITSNVSSYFHLYDINEDLQRHCLNLEVENIKLKEQIRLFQEMHPNDSISYNDDTNHFDYILAHVINNSISHTHNYLTINKGSNDGIKPEMGIIDQNGVVGIVNVVGENFSRVISLLNPDLRLSCKIKGYNNFGSLVWNAEDPTIAILEELPRHTIYKQGDSIVTSGFSSVFPEGIFVGTVISEHKGHNENFFTLKVKLSADLARLSTVKVIINNMKAELDSIEYKDNNKTIKL
ncbi:MAG: rod shape-determining protein MreC [Bacteroidales bacterium]|nr:rod shape-determining protein MreC [Bacteroidales bacterium]